MSKKLKIAVITNKELHTLKTKIRPAAEKRGHIFEILSPGLLEHTNLLDSDFVRSLQNYDVVYYRSGFSVSGAYVLGKYLRKMKVPSINFFHEKFPYYQRKLFQVEMVAAAGILTPKTITAFHVRYAALAESLGSTFIAKPDIGSQGKGIYKIESEEDFEVMNTEQQGVSLLFQEYIPHDFDYRVPVIGGKAVCPYKRVPLAGEFRANVTLGGETKPVELERKEELCVLAEKIAGVCGIEIMGVDMLPHRDTGKLYFAEVNDNPGWKEVSDVLGEDPSDEVVNLLEEQALCQS